MYIERERFNQLIAMCCGLFNKNQMTTVVLLLEPALPTDNLRLLEMLAKAYFVLGFYRSCRQVCLMACLVIKSSADYPQRKEDLCGYLHLIILSEIELNLAVAKQHEEQLRRQLGDGKQLEQLMREIKEARQRKQQKEKIDVEQVKEKFNQLMDKCTRDEYLKIEGVPVYLVSACWMKKFEEGQVEPINSFNIIEKSPYMDLEKGYCHMNYLVKAELQEQFDYIIVGKEPWNYLHSVFGGTEIKRMTIKNTVEVNYRIIKVLFLSPARMMIIEVPVSRSEVCRNLQNHLKRVLVWHKIIDKDSIAKQQRLLVVKDMHEPELLMKQIAANKLSKYTQVTELNELADFEDVELGLREFLIFEVSDDSGASVFGKQIVKQKIDGNQRCLTCLKKYLMLMQCDCKTVSFCSLKCKQANTKHADICKKLVHERNPLDSLLQTYNVNKSVRLPTDFRGYGKTGLENIGNTCFMNSALQCIANIQHLTMFMLRNDHLNDINMKNPLGSQGKLACAYGEFLKELFFTTRRCIEPRTIKKIIQRKNNQFAGYGQQDSQEFLSYFLDLLHEDLNRVKTKPSVENIESDGRSDSVISALSLENYRKRNDSIVSDLMVGQYKSELHCPDCGRTSITFDPFLAMPLPLPDDKQLTEAISGYPITLDGTIGKVQRKIPKNRLLSYFYELLGKQFACAYIKDKKIKQKIEGSESILNVSNSNSALFMYEVEQGANLELELMILDESKKPITFARRVLTKNIDSLDRLKQVISLRLKRPIGKYLDCYTHTDEDYLKICEEKEIINFQLVSGLQFPLKQNSITPISIIIDSTHHSKMKISEVQGYNMPTADQLSIPNLLKSFSTPEKLTEDNAWYCNKCKDHKLATKKLTLYVMPKYLVLHLKRFSHKINGRYVYNSKIDSSVKLAQFQQINGKRYELIGIVNHMGSMSGGHYTATVKKNEWLCFDDQRVRRDSPSGDYAYLLFYRQAAVV